jgi:multiple sugar transport system permease protein
MAVSLETRPALELPVDVRPETPWRRRRRLRQTPLAILLLLPALLIIGTFHFFPLLYAFFISLRNWGIVDQGMVWFKNYNVALHSRDFWQALVTMALACILAYLLFQKVRFLGAFRTLYFLPYVTSTVAAASVWLWIFNPRAGILNTMLGWVGIGPQRWTQESRGVFQLMLSVIHISPPGFLHGPSLALVAVMILTIWHQLGFQVVIFLVGLGNISSETYEAARMDGASEWQLFFRITLPLLAPMFYFLTIISTIFSFQAFNEIYIMSTNSNVGGAGGPLHSTQTVMVYVYNLFQVSHRIGYGSAIAFLLFLIIMGLTAIQVKFGNRYAQV